MLMSPCCVAIAPYRATNSLITDRATPSRAAISV